MRLSLGILISALVLSSCGIISKNIPSKVYVQPYYEDSQVYAVTSKGDTLQGGKEHAFSLKPGQSILFYEEAPDFRINSLPSDKSAFNPMALLDLGATIGLTYLILDAAYQPEEGDIVTPILTGSVGIYSTNLMSWKKHKKNQAFQKPLRLPTPPDESSNVTLAGIETNIPAKDFSIKVYSNRSKYEKGQANVSRFSDEAVSGYQRDVSNSINKHLSDWGFSDTTENLFKSSHNQIGIKGELIKVQFTAIGNILKAEGSVKWSLNDKLTDVDLHTSKYDVNSNWVFFKAHDDLLLENLIADLLLDGLVQFLSVDSVKSKLIDNTENLLEEIAESETISLSTSGGKKAENLADAIKASVTVLTKNGHGSGSIISPDGYIITNAHVVKASQEMEVLLDGQKVKADVIRKNPIYDIALLKVSKSDLTYYSIDKAFSNAPGTEVYAIGTPTSIDLGQSLTKGIISGNRKTPNHPLIQVDSPINEGNSGGGLALKEGSLIGVVSSKMFGYSIEGIGFALPTSTLEKALNIKLP